MHHEQELTSSYFLSFLSGGYAESIAWGSQHSIYWNTIIACKHILLDVKNITNLKYNIMKK